MLLIRKTLSFAMAALLPVSVFAADSNAAMLYTSGTTWLNGGGIPKSSAIFSGDLIQTKADSVANINAPGASVIVLPDSLIQFQGSAVKLEHGGVNVSTSKQLAAHAGIVSVTPSSNAWTEFEVRDVDGQVLIAARKGDVVVADDTGTATLAQGQQTTRDESDAHNKKKSKSDSAAPPASQPFLDTKTAIIIGAVVIGVPIVWVLIQGDDPLSPDKPK